jgi:L-asparaginase
MTKILLLTTGGTIASQLVHGGLSPALHGCDLLQSLGAGYGDCRFDCEDLLDLDSSNIQPEEWKLMAGRVFAALSDYDGIILTHGTDTLAYTAAALSFMLPNLPKSVVLTGSQLPIQSPLTDGVTNLYTAVEAVLHGITGVSVAFDRKILPGTRAVKVSTMGFDAFDAVNAGYLGQIFADGTRVFPLRPPGQTGGVCTLQDSLCTDVFLLKLLPGTRPDIFDALADMGYRGVVLEAFGAGGLHYLGRDLISRLRMLAERGVAVVVCSQCLYERCDLSIYEVGQRILEQGVIPGRDMTTEAAAVKLMWALGQTGSAEEVRRIFDRCYAGEVTVDEANFPIEK